MDECQAGGGEVLAQGCCLLPSQMEPELRIPGINIGVAQVGKGKCEFMALVSYTQELLNY